MSSASTSGSSWMRFLSSGWV
jgi:hypothetical protein